jgi:REP element-mobilizing transposase RayT
VAGNAGEAWEKTGWRIHAWVMMNNHYHLRLEMPEAKLVAGMKWLQGTCSQRSVQYKRAREKQMLIRFPPHETTSLRCRRGVDRLPELESSYILFP